jgi:hypothetical protein
MHLKEFDIDFILLYRPNTPLQFPMVRNAHIPHFTVLRLKQLSRLTFRLTLRILGFWAKRHLSFNFSTLLVMK